MRPQTLLQFLVVLVAWVCLGSTSATGQSYSDFQHCPVPSDETQKEVGKLSRPKVVINYLNFDGPIHLPDSVVDSMIGRLKQCEFDADSQWLDETLEMWIRATWQNEGYFKVQESARATPLGGDGTYQHFSVTVHIDEGLQYRVGDIRIAKNPGPDEGTEVVSGVRRRIWKEVSWDDPEGDPSARPIFPLEQLRKLIPLEEGDIVSAERVREGLDAMKRLYGAQGYIDFTATPFTDIDDEHKTVSFRFDLDEQKQFRIGKIEVIGLDAATRYALIWRLKPGDIFDYELFGDFFKDNQSLLPAGASPENAEIRRETKRALVDVKMAFHPRLK